MIDALKGRRRELCPFCFEYFLLRDTPFRCTTAMSRCPPVPDAVLKTHWGDSRPHGKILPSQNRFVRSIRCSDCGGESRKRLCPSCHSELPHTTGDYKNYIFAVIGAKEAGKSHYLAVLIDQIKRRVGQSMDMLLEEMTDDTIRRYREVFYDPVFKQQRIIEGTKSALVDQSVQKPLVYSLTMMGKNLLGKKTIRDAVVLVFFDTAGEDLNDEDTLSTVNKYIYRSDGILLLVDPLQLPRVRDRLDKTTPLPSMNTETADILTRTTRLVQKGQELKATDRIPIPLAVAFSKFDAVKPLVDDQFQLNAAAHHDGGFDAQDFQAINGEMMALLDDWGGEDLVHQVRSRYSSFGFFGLSALGCNPHASQQIPRVVPRRVEDPFLWLLSQNNLIRKVRR
jgi:hypothetical protein